MGTDQVQAQRGEHYPCFAVEGVVEGWVVLVVMSIRSGSGFWTPAPRVTEAFPSVQMALNAMPDWLHLDLGGRCHLQGSVGRICPP